VSPSADRRSPTRWLVPAALVVVAIVVAAVVASRGSDEAPPASPTTTAAPELDPVAVSSDAPRSTSLDELVAASDLVVRAKVTDAEPGRWFGDGSTSARIRSRLVTLDVEDVLAGDVPPGELGTLLLEEEGWTEDGAPLVVDGAAPSAVGDEGIWFLVDPGDETTDSLIVVNAQGRYLVDGDHLAGASGDDPLVADLAKGSLADLEARIRA
jgi:hypothetical protein